MDLIFKFILGKTWCNAKTDFVLGLVVFLSGLSFFPSCKETRSPLVSAVDSFPPYVNRSVRFDWTKVETNVSDTLKLNFYRDYLMKMEGELFQDSGMFQYSVKDLCKYLHFIDLNADKKLDVVYDGVAPETEMTLVFLNRKDKFHLVFDEMEAVNRMVFSSKGNLQMMYCTYYGCCAEYVRQLKGYAVKTTGEFKLVKARAMMEFLQYPNRYFSRPIEIRFNKANIALRSSPEVNDTSTLIYDSYKAGNKLGRYPYSSKGYVWAQLEDKQKQLWCMVEMLPSKKVKDALFQYVKIPCYPHAIGWVMKKDLEFK